MSRIRRVGDLTAIWDLAQLSTLSTVPGLLLLVSERTKYILNNLAMLDISDLTRYAVQLGYDGLYVPVREDDATEYQLAKDVVEAAQLEILEIGNVPIETVLWASDETFSQVAGATTYTHQFSIVPVGQIWRVEAWNVNLSVLTTGQFLIYSTGDQNQNFYRQPTLPAGISAGQLSLTLSPGTRLNFLFWGVTVGQTILGGYNFYALPVSAP